MDNTKQTIFITGAAGFIGLNFVKFILKNTDWNIVGIDKITYASKPAIFDMFKKEYSTRLILIKEDICNRLILDDLFNKYKPTYLVNFAAESHVDNSINNSSVFIHSNIIGTYSLLESSRKYVLSLSRKEKFRFHHVSTDEIYGDLPIEAKIKFTENSQINPSSPYSASKAASDLLVKAWFKTYKLPITISNCSNNFGPYQHDEKFLPTIIRNIVNNTPIPIYGNGTNVRDWIHVNEHCNAIFKILTEGKIGETYCVGCNCELSNNEIVKIVRDELKNKYNLDSKVSFVKDRQGHDKKYAINSYKLETELEWKPIVKNQLQYFPEVIEYYYNYYTKLINICKY